MYSRKRATSLRKQPSSVKAQAFKLQHVRAASFQPQSPLSSCSSASYRAQPARTRPCQMRAQNAGRMHKRNTLFLSFRSGQARCSAQPCQGAQLSLLHGFHLPILVGSGWLFMLTCIAFTAEEDCLQEEDGTVIVRDDLDLLLQVVIALTH